MTALAELLDQLHGAKRAHLDEREVVVTVSRLSPDDTKAVLDLCETLGWEASALDKANNEALADTLADKFAPYKVMIRKADPDGGLQLLTARGFAYWLANGHEATRWIVARLPKSIVTRGILFAAANDSQPYEPFPPTKNPRSIVRDSGAERSVPADIRPWLLAPGSPPWSDHPLFQLWADAAGRAIINSLPEEIDPEDRSLRFTGPPRLALVPPAHGEAVASGLGREGFAALQEAAAWVFEDESEAEMRHILLAAELARSGGTDTASVSWVKQHVAVSLQSAKIAYQVARAALSRDTLDLLADLRKAVTEETAKVTEATRQNVTAVAGALAIGLGLLAARVTAVADPRLVMAVMIVVAVYVATIIYSANAFVMLQRKLRGDWKQSLYRFLPEPDYTRMVETPTLRAETVFRRTAGWGLFAIILLTLVVLFFPAEASSPASRADRDGPERNAALASPSAEPEARPKVEVAPSKQAPRAGATKQ